MLLLWTCVCCAHAWKSNFWLLLAPRPFFTTVNYNDHTVSCNHDGVHDAYRQHDLVYCSALLQAPLLLLLLMMMVGMKTAPNNSQIQRVVCSSGDTVRTVTQGNLEFRTSVGATLVACSFSEKICLYPIRAYGRLWCVSQRHVYQLYFWRKISPMRFLPTLKSRNHNCQITGTFLSNHLCLWCDHSSANS